MSRKPRDYKNPCAEIKSFCRYVAAGVTQLNGFHGQALANTPKEARRLAKYLLEWADWTEAKDE